MCVACSLGIGRGLWSDSLRLALFRVGVTLPDGGSEEVRCRSLTRPEKRWAGTQW